VALLNHLIKERSEGFDQMLFKIFNYDDMMDVVTANLYEKMILESVRKYLYLGSVETALVFAGKQKRVVRKSSV
jgi:hypothetical protein